MMEDIRERLLAASRDLERVHHADPLHHGVYRTVVQEACALPWTDEHAPVDQLRAQYQESVTDERERGVAYAATTRRALVHVLAAWMTWKASQVAGFTVVVSPERARTVLDHRHSGGCCVETVADPHEVINDAIEGKPVS